MLFSPFSAKTHPFFQEALLYFSTIASGCREAQYPAAVNGANDPRTFSRALGRLRKRMAGIQC